VFHIVSVWPSLTVRLQTELGVNTHTMVSEMHHTMVKIKADDQNQLVSNIHTLFHQPKE